MKNAQKREKNEMPVIMDVKKKKELVDAKLHVMSNLEISCEKLVIYVLCHREEEVPSFHFLDFLMEEEREN